MSERGSAKALSSHELLELLEDDEDADTGLIRVEYDENMQKLAEARARIVRLKHNIPPPPEKQ